MIFTNKNKLYCTDQISRITPVLRCLNSGRPAVTVFAYNTYLTYTWTLLGMWLLGPLFEQIFVKCSKHHNINLTYTVIKTGSLPFHLSLQNRFNSCY